MRDENKRSKNQPPKKQNISNRPLEKRDKNISSGSGLIGEHDLSNAAEKKIGRTPHDKDSVTGSERDGQTD